MEYIYRLNLPPLEQVLLDHDRDIVPMNGSLKPLYVVKKSKDLFKQEWLTFLGLDWDRVLVFYKPNGYIGRTHIDDINNPVWGINWISGGTGIIEYWDSNKIEEPETTHDTNGYVIKDYDKCVKNITAHKSYVQNQGVYLVNAGFPHRATGYDNRVCVSLRTENESGISWHEIVDKFKDYIV